MPAVEARDLGKRFRRRLDPAPPTFKERVVGLVSGRGGSGGVEEFWALREVGFRVEAGEMFGVIGANGSGKSTLLKLLAGIYRPDEGSLACQGRLVSLIELGAGFHPDLSGRENVLINGLLLGLSRQEVREAYPAIVEFSGLGRFMESPVRTYSSGMYMRLGFAIAAHARPDILLVDEILAVGDELFQHQCLGRIHRFLGEGKAIVLVSHDLGTVARLCHRVLWLEEGRVRAVGLAREVVDRYLERVEAVESARLMAEHHRLSVEEFGQGRRWGTGEVSLGGLSLAGPDGAERYLFHTGEPLTLTLRYRADRPVEDVVFGVGIHRDDGVLCYGTNTQIDGVSPPAVEGEGRVTLEIPALTLLEGTYLLDVAVHRRDGYPYDYHSRCYRLEVRSPVKDVGVARLPHTWRVAADGAVAGTDMRSAPGTPGRATREEGGRDGA
jgi:ABC-type polysaccharide/polyol phosphate transport system ATPase subunit